MKAKCMKCPAVLQVGDGNPLRRWRVSVEVEAPPSVVLNRVLRERHLWDVDLLQWRVCEVLDKQTEVFQYVLNRMPPHPSRDFVVLRYVPTHIICSVRPLMLQQRNYWRTEHVHSDLQVVEDRFTSGRVLPRVCLH